MEFLIPVNDFVLPASSMEFPVFANEISPPSAEENEPTPMTLLTSSTQQKDWRAHDPRHAVYA